MESPLVQIYSAIGAGVIVVPSSWCQSSTNDTQFRPHQDESIDKRRAGGQRNVANHWNETETIDMRFR
jgi:hypothetical protein